ncbi:MAG: fumarylacetoacetate hydrolase family protein [Bryobacteraceae bacterium]|jgi:2-keto-4-pentenoate hydratase/2-oxohepta-3-ene-1,7-dioic acid hydratase in catechol pathway
MIRFVRYRADSAVSYGILEEAAVREIRGDPFHYSETGAVRPLSEVKLLCPCQPSKILAVGGNYRSHMDGRPLFAHPEIFFMPPSALQNPGDPIRIPRDAIDVHYEGELVVIIGQRLRDATPDEAREGILGVTCGNDVSDRNWQHGPGKDMQWWRAKGSDTFAPLGPAVVTGLDYGNLQLETRLNGETVQKQTTADLIFDCAAIVSWISGWVTLEPGDAIYTGTPGSTRRIAPGDVVEVEIEGIGVLRNPVE